MIITRTPFRVSLFGGSCDREEFYSKHGAKIVGFALDKYCYLSVREPPAIFREKFRLSYSKMELANSIKEIQHNGIRGFAEYFNVKKLELSHVSDIPSQTGLGSSSAFIIGLIKAYYELQQWEISKRELAETAIYIERKLLEEPGGNQDQIWSAYGGINSITINTSGKFDVKPLPLSTEEITDFLSHCFLYYVGNRQSFEIAKIENSSKNEESQKRILEQAEYGYEALVKCNWEDVGTILDSYWQEKKSLNNGVSNNHIDAIYNELLENGMVGGKLLGSGGSGFIFGVLYDKGTSFRKKYKKHLIPLGIDYLGSVTLNANPKPTD